MNKKGRSATHPISRFGVTQIASICVCPLAIVVGDFQHICFIAIASLITRGLLLTDFGLDI